MSRTLNVVRMQLINRQTYIWVPLLILGGAFLLTLAVYGLLQQSGVTGPKFSGGSQAPLWYFCVIGVQALTLTFPFSQAMSVTRREFYAGTLLTAAGSSLALAVLFVLGGFVEEATGGWGMNGYFFYIPWMWEGGPAAAALAWFTSALLVFISGFWAATIYKRAGAFVLTLVLVALGALIVLWMFLVGRMDAWAQVFDWIAVQGAAGLSLWGLLLAAVLAGVAFLTLRRAVP